MPFRRRSPKTFEAPPRSGGVAAFAREGPDGKAKPFRSSGGTAAKEDCHTPTQDFLMSDTTILISALETAPGVIIPLIREVPPQILKRRPSPAKWSAYEHAIHLSQSDVAFRARLDLILSTSNPIIKTIENSPEDEAGAMLDIDLDESLERYERERAALVKRLKKLSPNEWRKTAVHEAFDHYSVFIMFRHLLNHEMLHAYRIEELLLKKDWDKIG